VNDDAITRFQAEAVETIASLKELFREFEKQLGETVSAQRLASSEARAEAADARATLRKLLKRVEETASEQREALDMLRENWWFNIEENAKASGAGMAREFGKQIAAGLEERLKILSADVDRVTRRLGWVTTLKWSAGIGLGIFLTILIGVYAFTPQTGDLSSNQAQAALAELVPCQVEKAQHVCVKLDDKPRLSKLPGGPPIAVIRGL
jgi:hypothetical protein